MARLSHAFTSALPYLVIAFILCWTLIAPDPIESLRPRFSSWPQPLAGYSSSSSSSSSSGSSGSGSRVEAVVLNSKEIPGAAQQQLAAAVQQQAQLDPASHLGAAHAPDPAAAPAAYGRRGRA